MTFGSLFSGIGGMDLGLERAGMVCKWQVEIDGYARRVLEKHWPHVRRWDDVRTFPPPLANAIELQGSERHHADEKRRREKDPEQAWLDCELIAGGFPCQPVSVAGRRQAASDPRWLWPHFARVVRTLRPSFVLVENVPGLLVPGYGFDEVMGDLSHMGFDAEWATIPASAFGAPHKRERVFIVAYTDSKNAQARIFRASREVASMPFPCWGSDKPGVDRASARSSHRVDRLRGLGNAVVPQVAQWLGERILAYERSVH